MPRSDHIACLLFAAAVAIVISPAAGAQPTNQTFTYREACDGSAATALGQDEFAVADDDSNVLRIYRIGETKPAWSLAVDKFLAAPPKKKGGFKEADIEAAARIDDRIYWIGSHGRDSNGNAEPSRARFFATRMVTKPDGRQLEVVGSGAFNGLRDALFADPKLADLKLRESYAPDKKNGGPEPESENGFNIEGLAATADRRLLIGFRNPRPNNQAIVIPMHNPAAVVEKGIMPVFGRPILLNNLGGRGIRSIDRIGERYVIIAGPHGTAANSKIKPAFALFTWTGDESDTKPSMMQDVLMPADFSPEALFASEDGSTLTLLSDDGDLNGCKKADTEQKTFRALRIPAPK